MGDMNSSGWDAPFCSSAMTATVLPWNPLEHVYEKGADPERLKVLSLPSAVKHFPAKPYRTYT